MANRDNQLTIVLQVLGVTTILALGAVVMPRSWMAATHEWLGLGGFPAAPIVENLARSVSAFYAIFGAVCLFVASDIERYRPLIKFLGAVLMLFGAVLIVIDLAAGMPPWWTASEGLSTIVFGVLLVALSRSSQ
jgi:hypothetical protein